MREITSYQAFDGKLFNNKQDCTAYESEHLAYRMEISTEIAFLDCNRNIIFAPASTDEYFEQKLEDAYNLARFLVIHNNLSDVVINFFEEEFGWVVPREAGEYRYDGDEDKWIKFTSDFLKFCQDWKLTAREVLKRLTQ